MPLLPHPLEGAFVAIDFETADYGADSACAVGLVRVEGLTVVRRETVLIRPPRREFIFTYIHGITWRAVSDAPLFAEAWPRLLPILDGVSFLAAHNAPFDRRVLSTCCAIAGIGVPEVPFLCTVQLARGPGDNVGTISRQSAAASDRTRSPRCRVGRRSVRPNRHRGLRRCRKGGAARDPARNRIGAAVRQGQIVWKIGKA